MATFGGTGHVMKLYYVPCAPAKIKAFFVLSFSFVRPNLQTVWKWFPTVISSLRTKAFWIPPWPRWMRSVRAASSVTSDCRCVSLSSSPFVCLWPALSLIGGEVKTLESFQNNTTTGVCACACTKDVEPMDVKWKVRLLLVICWLNDQKCITLKLYIHSFIAAIVCCFICALKLDGV